MKRYIYIIIGIVVVAVLAILVLLYIKDRSTNAPTITSPNGTGSLPATGTQANSTGTQVSVTQNNSSSIIALGAPSATSTNGQTVVQSFGLLSNQPVLDYYVDLQNNIVAIQPTGAIISISNGQTIILSSSTTDNIISGSFSYDGKKALVSFGDPTNPQSAIFDIKTKTWTTLPAGIQSPQWSSNSYQVAFLTSLSNGQEALSMINVASLKSGVGTLLTLHANDMTLQWPTKTQFIISDKPTVYINGSSWLFNSSNGSLTSLVYENAGLESNWSHTINPIGLIFSTGISGQKQILQLMTLSGSTPQQLTIATLPSKCAFDPETTATSTTSITPTAYIAMYCGVPRGTSGFSSARLPDDYETMSLFTSDDIYKINTTNGQTQVLWSDQTQNMDTSDLKVFNNTLFFVNRYDQKLYGLIFG